MRLLSYSTCKVVQQGNTGNATKAHAILMFDTKNDIPGAYSAKAESAITWVGAVEGVQDEVRLYDRLFSDPHPDADGKGFIEALNPDSLKVLTAFVEPSLAQALPDQKFQFEWFGYLVAVRLDHIAEGNREFSIGLRD